MLWGEEIKTWHWRKGFLQPWHLSIDKCRLKQTSRETLKGKKSHKRPIWGMYGMGRGILTTTWKMVKHSHVCEKGSWQVNELIHCMAEFTGGGTQYPHSATHSGTEPQASTGHTATQVKVCNSLPPLQLGVGLHPDCYRNFFFFFQCFKKGRKVFLCLPSCCQLWMWIWWLDSAHHRPWIFIEDAIA